MGIQLQPVSATEYCGYARRLRRRRFERTRPGQSPWIAPFSWIGRTRSPGRTLRAVSNHTYTLLGCSTFRYGIKRTTHPLPTEGVIMALRGVAAESAAREETPRGEEMS
jgi:hypothetical protein